MAGVLAGVLRRVGRGRTTRGVRMALRELRTELRISRLHRASVKRARLYDGRTGLMLNLGCGPNLKAGWINVDLSPDAELHLDLREPLPFADGSVAMIYSEHFFEHLSYASAYESGAWSALEVPGHPSEVMTLLRESFRALMPDGVFSLALPDAERVVRAYAAGDREVFAADARVHPEWCDTPMHHVNFTFRQGREHKYAYDAETLTRILQSAGFVSVVRRSFDPALDSERRSLGTLYMEGRKPAPDSPRSPSSGA